MPKSSSSTPQHYPRIQDRSSAEFGCLDDTTLVQHSHKLAPELVKQFIRRAIDDANRKSSRALLDMPLEATDEQLNQRYGREGRKLLEYFKQYAVDPAATAYQVQGQHYREVGVDLFRRRMLQKERMNAGWRYQYLTLYCARESKRFRSVSDLGSQEGDFNAVIEFVNYTERHLNLFVSVKNRRNTIGGQDFPKAARALESLAANDKNRRGPYLCVFGIAMDRGGRQIRRDSQGREHSLNTEVWLSDYFWPFFTNYSYEEIMLLVLEVLEGESQNENLPTQADVPEGVLQSFGQACFAANLTDDTGIFISARQIIRFICARN
ncbi:MAG: hypothetical protein SF162_12755 [bacterium]|nr:hypothetical protein [bacterium]